MDPIEKRELKRQAWRRLAAQRRRAGLLRGRVVAVSLVCFALLWGIVFVQMATGNDPVLSAKKGVAGRTGASARREVEKTDRRQRKPAGEHHPKARAREEEETGDAEAVAEEPVVEAEPELEEAAPEEVEPEAAPAEVTEVEPEPEPELVEEPLVTSQS